MSYSKEKAREILGFAGIKISGNRSWDIRIHNEKTYDRVFSQGSLGLGESYMDGWWDVEKLDEFFYKIFTSNLDKKINLSPKLVFHVAKSRLLNMQSKSRAFKVGEEHYDLGNDLYEAMLDKRLVYTCAYWKNAKSLDKAQEAKLDLVCKKLQLKKGDKILDIGCGWGSFAKFAAEKYHVKVIGITVSKEQAELARKLCKGLNVEIRLQDYREVNEKFDHIVSLGMFEHVGYKNYKEYFKIVEKCLKPNGLFLLHTIGNNISTFKGDPWIDKYIFPNGMLPSIAQISKASEKLLILEDLHNFGPDYDKTLMAWFNNFNKNYSKLNKEKYNERFYRMWKYYLLLCAALFRSRKIQLWQIVFSKDRLEKYEAVR